MKNFTKTAALILLISMQSNINCSNNTRILSTEEEIYIFNATRASVTKVANNGLAIANERYNGPLTMDAMINLMTNDSMINRLSRSPEKRNISGS